MTNAENWNEQDHPRGGADNAGRFTGKPDTRPEVGFNDPVTVPWYPADDRRFVDRSPIVNSGKEAIANLESNPPAREVFRGATAVTLSRNWEGKTVATAEFAGVNVVELLCAARHLDYNSKAGRRKAIDWLEENGGDVQVFLENLGPGVRTLGYDWESDTQLLISVPLEGDVTFHAASEALNASIQATNLRDALSTKGRRKFLADLRDIADLADENGTFDCHNCGTNVSSETGDNGYCDNCSTPRDCRECGDSVPPSTIQYDGDEDNTAVCDNCA